MKSKASIEKPTFFIIPGFRQEDQGVTEQFGWLEKEMKHRGFRTFLVPIKWKYRTMSDYISQFKTFYEKHRSSNNQVLGFSYGAVIAFSTATELRPKKIWLCSLSPDFKEDLPWAKKRFGADNLEKWLGKRRLDDISMRSGLKLAKSLDIPATLFYGEIEAEKFTQLKKRVDDTVKHAKQARVVVVPKAPHSISHPNYKEALIKYLPHA